MTDYSQNLIWELGRTTGIFSAWFKIINECSGLIFKAGIDQGVSFQTDTQSEINTLYIKKSKFMNYIIYVCLKFKFVVYLI